MDCSLNLLIKINSDAEVGHLLANAGYKTVLMPTTHLNFDAAHASDPQMRGSMNDARFSDLAKVFSFRPLNFYENGLFDFWGNKQSSNFFNPFLK